MDALERYRGRCGQGVSAAYVGVIGDMHAAKDTAEAVRGGYSRHMSLFLHPYLNQ